MSLGRRWLIVGVVVSSATGLIALAGWLYTRVFPDPTEHSRAYANQIQIAGGYVDISAGDGANDSCNCVQRWYVGPAGADPSVVFSGTGLAWRLSPDAAATTSPVPERQPLVRADVTTSDAGPCYVSVTRLAPARPLQDVLAMSADQVDGWNQRRLDVLELLVMCDRDAGRL
jgi:hypothetical protein